MIIHSPSAGPLADRVVILGAGGFVSPALATYLTGLDIEVAAIGSRLADLSDPAARACLLGLLRKGDALVMAAALTPDKGKDLATCIKNLRMAETVAAVVAEAPVAQLVYLSSDAVYGWKDVVVSEETPPSPNDLYGTMHLAREFALQAAADRAGIPYCVLRPCAIYGPGDTHNGYGPNRFVRSALKDRVIRLFGGGEETRDHVYIGDVTRLLGEVLRRRSRGLLNIASGQSIAFGDLAARVASLSQLPVRIESQPRTGPCTHRQFDPQALRARFPSFVPTPLDEGLRALLHASAND